MCELNPCNPCTGGVQDYTLGISPKLANAANLGALQSKMGGGATITGGLIISPSNGSAVAGNYDAANNNTFPNKFTLIIDPTANAGTVTDFPLFDNLGVFKKINVVRQATAAIGTVYGLSGSDNTKVYFEDPNNTFGYDVLLADLCTGGFVIQAFSAWHINATSGQAQPVDLPMSIRSIDTYGELSTKARFNPIQNIMSTLETQSVVGLDRDTKHVSGKDAVFINSLPNNKVIYMQFVTVGKVS